MTSVYHAQQFPLFIEHLTEDCTCEGKICTKCQRLICVLKFTIDRQKKDNLRSECKDCKNAPGWRWLNVDGPFEHLDIGCHCPGRKCSKCRQNKCHLTFRPNPSGVRSDCRICENTHVRAYQKAIPDIVKNRKYNYRQQHEDEIRISRRKYNAEHHTECLERKRKGNSKRRARDRQVEGEFTTVQWDELKRQYNYTCLCCMRRVPEISLTADHVIPISKGGSNYIENIQPLCGRCNAKKGVKIIDYRMLWKESIS